ncbi:MAG TPA: hypothetical protein PLR25_27025 [Planctomycetaceae bacterium]|nr:hypothetical protein [Planctomycetaceae bacterium]
MFKIASGIVKLWPGSQAALLKQIISRFYSEIVENDMRRIIWKITFERSEKLNTKRWLEAHVDFVVHGLKNTSDD